MNSTAKPMRESVMRKEGAQVGRKLGVSLLIIAAIGLCSFIALPVVNKKEAPPALVISGFVEAHEIQVGSKVGGRVSEVMVKSGQLLKPGEPLIRFDIKDLLVQRAQLEAKTVQARAYLAKLENGNRPEEISQAEAVARREHARLLALKNGPRPQEIAQAKAELAAAQSDYENALANFSRFQELYKQDYVSRVEFDNVTNHKNIAKAKLAACEQKVALLEAGTRAEEIDAAAAQYQQAEDNARMMRAGTRKEDITDARARLAEAEAALEKLTILIAEGEVVSPSHCRIETISARPGDLLPPGKLIAKLLEEDQIWIRAYVPENELGRVFIGQQAGLTIDTFANRVFTGKVTEISSQGEYIPRNLQTRDDRKHQVFAVKIEIENSEKLFKSGMTADVRLEVK